MSYYQEWETQFRNMEDLFRTMARDPNLALHKMEDMFEESKQVLQDIKDDWQENADEYKQEFIDKYGPEEGLEKYEEAAAQIENIDPAIVDEMTDAWNDFISNYDTSELEDILQDLGEKMQEVMRNNPDMTLQKMEQAFYKAMYEVQNEHGYQTEASYSNEEPETVTANMQQKLEEHLHDNPEIANGQSLHSLTIGGASAIKAPFNAHVNGLGTSAQPGLEQNIQPHATPEADVASTTPEIKHDTLGI